MMAAKILVVDDESDVELLYLQKFRNQIKEGSYDFIFTKNGFEALDKIKENSDVDLVISDINMPLMDGLTLIGKIRDEYPLMRSVVVSAYGDMNNIRSAMNRGAYDFVTKPIDFNDLEVTINKTIELIRNLKKAQESEKKLNVITTELDVSAQLQRSILPGNHLKKEKLELFANMITAAEVGGDFYDFFWLDDSHLGVVIADVSGKNISAALFMTITKTMLKAFSRAYKSPAECLKQVNNALFEENPTMMFVTALYGIINTKTGSFTYSNAGHLPPIIINPKHNPKFLETEPSLVLGIDNTTDFINSEYKFKNGDVLFLYTDGVTEAADANGNEYGYNKFIKCLKRNSTLLPKDITKSVISSVHEFTAGAPQSDDITTLCVKYGSDFEHNHISVLIKSDLSEIAVLFDLVEKFCKANNISENKLHDLQFILDEIASNIINYGFKNETNHKILVKFKLINNSVIKLQLIDNSEAFNPLLKNDPDISSSLENRPIGGLGIYLTKKLAQSVSYRNILGFNILTINLALKDNLK